MTDLDIFSIGIEKIIEILSILMLSVLVPTAIFIGRNNIRAFRRDLVRDLEHLFDFAKQKDGKSLIIPSFELVKYKYDPDSNPERSGAAEAHSFQYYLLPVTIYSLICFCGFWTAFASGQNFSNNIFLQPLLYNPSSTDQSHYFTLSVVSYAFAGGYCWTVNYLIKRISNFDLSPLSFLRCCYHIIFGIFVAVTCWHVASSFFDEPALGSTFTVGIAFLIGIEPRLMLDKLMARYPWMRLKRTKKETKDLQEELPLDTILGIDSYMKFRLSEFEIEDVQNLATTNPIQLFVETPYGLYEVVDWVAQAQLILAVGTKKTSMLRSYNIRTIFDLEKSMDNDFLKRKLTEILTDRKDLEGIKFRASGKKRESVVENSSELELDPSDYIEAIVAIIRDDLHVKRLRQIWDVIKIRVDERPGQTEKDKKKEKNSKEELNSYDDAPDLQSDDSGNIITLIKDIKNPPEDSASAQDGK
ncbi:hypothetical protein [Azospirillum sp. SYSU D00513]|uniref:hypothetical protein n=1 Tax=Azospirillum sp. SYSU D00513 TaxID=2812561 RepID=UPI001A95FB14|nr:hypothetical protein [Azospirillum sp. SYSU D00513]